MTPSYKWHVPMPREHGGWVMIGVGLALGAATSSPSGWVLVLLAMAALSGFLAHEPLRNFLARQKREAAPPLILTLGIAAAAGLGVWALSGAHNLWWVALIDGGLVGIYAARLRGRGRARADRSVGGQVVASVVLTSCIPATMIAGGALGLTPWLLWGLSAVYFCGGILIVHAVLEVVRGRKDLSRLERFERAKHFLVCHGALFAGMAVWASLAAHPWASASLVAAPLPACVRALWRWRALSPVLPSMKRIGMGELALSLWFAACVAAAVRLL